MLNSLQKKAFKNLAESMRLPYLSAKDVINAGKGIYTTKSGNQQLLIKEAVSEVEKEFKNIPNFLENQPEIEKAFQDFEKAGIFHRFPLAISTEKVWQIY